jgi:hypothetical protein
LQRMDISFVSFSRDRLKIGDGQAAITACKC